MLTSVSKYFFKKTLKVQLCNQTWDKFDNYDKFNCWKNDALKAKHDKDEKVGKKRER